METYFHAFIALLIFPGGVYAILTGLFLKGVDRKIVARLQRRVGPPIWQPALDIVKLGAKETLIPTSANQTAFRLAPALGLTGALAAVAVLPVPGVWHGAGDAADIIVLLYVLTLPALAFMLGGSASSSPFGALGFSREMIIMFAYEIPLLVTLLAVVLRADGAFSLIAIADYQIVHGAFLLDPVMWPAFFAYLMFIPGTMGSGLFDIPEAETEIVEGPILEYSGPLLALFNLMSGLKLVIVLGLGVVLFFPTPLPGGPFVNALWHLGKCLALMLLSVTLFRAATGRLRIDQAFVFFLKYPSTLAYVSLGMVYLLD